MRDAPKIAPDDGKLAELTLYVAAKCGLDQHYGVLKLNKILFYADFTAFKVHGRSITGAQYRKYPHGPAPACMKYLRHKLVDNHDAYEYLNPLPAVNADGEPIAEKRLLAIKKPELDAFTPEQIAIVDSMIEWLRPLTGHQASELSHRHPGWRLAGMEEEIPYCSALIPDEQGPLSAADFKRASAVAERFESGAIQA